MGVTIFCEKSIDPAFGKFSNGISGPEKYIAWEIPQPVLHERRYTAEHSKADRGSCRCCPILQMEFIGSGRATSSF
jgi:hypothetical protein